MATIEGVAQRAVKPLLDNIPREVDARIRRFLEAFSYYSRAQTIAGRGHGPEHLHALQSSITQAIELEPTISGMYALAARAYYVATANMYWRERVPERYGSSFPLPRRDAFPSVSANASYWLHKAVEHHDADKGELFEKLALLNGMMSAPLDTTLGYVRLAKKVGRAFPADASALLKLLGSCTSEADIGKLSIEVRNAAPLSATAVEVLLREREPVRDPARGIPLEDYANSVELLVVSRFELNDGRYPMSPGMVLVLYGRPGEALVRRRRRVQTALVVQNDGIPPFREADAATGASGSSNPVAIEELAKSLISDFYVFGAFTGHPGNY